MPCLAEGARRVRSPQSETSAQPSRNGGDNGNPRRTKAADAKRRSHAPHPSRGSRCVNAPETSDPLINRKGCRPTTAAHRRPMAPARPPAQSAPSPKRPGGNSEQPASAHPDPTTWRRGSPGVGSAARALRTPRRACAPRRSAPRLDHSGAADFHKIARKRAGRRPPTSKPRHTRAHASARLGGFPTQPPESIPDVEGPALTRSSRWPHGVDASHSSRPSYL